VNVSGPTNGSYQHIHDQQVLGYDNGSYDFKFQIKHYQFWRPFNITIAVNNSVGASPFSNHMIVRGANNGIMYD